MSTNYRRTIAAVIILALMMIWAGESSAAVGGWKKSATVDPRWSTDYSSETFKESMRNLKATNANRVTLVIPLYQSWWGAHDVHERYHWNTPTNESLAAGIAYARSIGLSVTLKPHLEADGEPWRAKINPQDKDMWFAAYGDKMVHYATIGQANGADQFIIASELITISTDPDNSQRWNSLIDRVRAVFPAPKQITYSANWGGDWWTDEKNRIPFWDKLDSIGIAAYFPLNSCDWWNNNNVEAYKGRWEQWNNQGTPWGLDSISQLKNRWGKNVEFTEVGYKSVDGASCEPFASWRGGNASQAEQANLYEALFSYWNGQSWMTGVHLWDWESNPNGGGWWTTTYTPQNKDAQAVMTRWFGNAAPTATPTPSATPNPTPEPANPSFSDTTSITPSTPTPGQNATVNSSVTNSGTGGPFTGIVDMEIYNSSEQKVFQDFKENESLAAGQTKNYSFSPWTAGPNGNYKIKVGIFNPGWSANRYWNENAHSFTVGTASTPTPTPTPSATPIPTPTPSPTPTPTPTATPSAGDIEIWWPTDGVTVSGTQPFKILLQNKALWEYIMYWQVDGDQLNQMSDSQEDWPHKESLVDLSGWTWRGSGPYRVNFVAKDLTEKILNQKEININVSP